VSTYPCVALLAFSGQRTKLVALVQGRVRAPELLAALRRAVDEQGMLLMAEQLEQEERVRGGGLLSDGLLQLLFEAHLLGSPSCGMTTAAAVLEKSSSVGTRCSRFTCRMMHTTGVISGLYTLCGTCKVSICA
jgi:hypothetical protein